MMFEIGQKVVCITDNWAADALIALYAIQFPKEGEIYTIRGIVPGSNPDYTGLYLEEITNPVIEGVTKIGEPNFDSFGFRPLVEQSTETGVAIVRRIVNDIFQKELV